VGCHPEAISQHRGDGDSHSTFIHRPGQSRGYSSCQQRSGACEFPRTWKLLFPSCRRVLSAPKMLVKGAQYSGRKLKRR